MLPRSTYIKTLQDKTIDGAKALVQSLHDNGFHFKKVLIQIGSNDLVSSTSSSVFQNYLSLISLIRHLWPGVIILISGILYRYVISNFYNTRRMELNKKLATLAKNSKDTIFVPQFLNAKQTQPDGIHPTFDGLSFLVNRIVATLEGKEPPPIIRPELSSSSNSASTPQTSPRRPHLLLTHPSRPSPSSVSIRRDNPNYPSQNFISYKDALLSSSQPRHSQHNSTHQFTPHSRQRLPPAYDLIMRGGASLPYTLLETLV